MEISEETNDNYGKILDITELKLWFYCPECNEPLVLEQRTKDSIEHCMEIEPVTKFMKSTESSTGFTIQNSRMIICPKCDKIFICMDRLSQIIGQTPTLEKVEEVPPFNEKKFLLLKEAVLLKRS